MNDEIKEQLACLKNSGVISDSTNYRKRVTFGTTFGSVSADLTGVYLDEKPLVRDDLVLKYDGVNVDTGPVSFNRIADVPYGKRKAAKDCLGK